MLEWKEPLAVGTGEFTVDKEGPWLAQ